MEQKNNDNRTYEEIRAGWEKDGLVIVKLMSNSEQRETQKRIDDEAHKAEYKRIEKEMRRSRSKPPVLVGLSGFFAKILHTIVALLGMGMFVFIYFIWQIYKAVSAADWTAIFKTQYSLYIVVYLAVFFAVKAIYYQLYKYANT